MSIKIFFVKAKDLAKVLIWHRLGLANMLLFGLIAFLAHFLNGGAGPHPEVVTWAKGETSFNMPMQIVIVMSSFLALSLIGIILTYLIAFSYAKQAHERFYAKYTGYMFAIAALGCVLLLVCPTVPGADIRIMVCAFVGTQFFLFGVLNSLLTMQTILTNKG